MQTLDQKAQATTRRVWYLNSELELEVWLEDYTTFIDGQGEPPDGGDIVDLDKLDRWHRLMLQNGVIDGGMRDLLWSDRIAWRLINQYYRQGMWAERRGWVVPARSAGIDVPICLNYARCRVQGDDRKDLEFCRRGPKCVDMNRKFEEVRAGSVHALFVAIMGRQQRTLDNSQRTRYS